MKKERELELQKILDQILTQTIKIKMNRSVMEIADEFWWDDALLDVAETLRDYYKRMLESHVHKKAREKLGK